LVIASSIVNQIYIRGGGKPRLSDLRESGSIEQDADVVGLLVRPEFYETNEKAKQELSGDV
jgi:replicative DNA helicase